MSFWTRTDRVRKEVVIVVDCCDCKETFGYTGTSRHPGTMALQKARTHAFEKQHRVIVHRSTEYDGRPK